jgi:hypothetical protein
MYDYRRIPFCLINTGAMFQMEMDIAFKGLISQSVVIYLDDVIFYSNKMEDRLKHLKHIFERCRKYGIYLNPKKTIFSILE